jgi:two-component system cell cycle response regulator DivK
MTPVTILYIEDNAPNVTVVERIIESMGHQLIVATNARDGLDIVFRDKPDIILMDISLPDMDGLTATKLIRADAVMGNVPIIAVTANAMVGDREKCLEAGCNEYLQKPIMLKTLVNALKPYVTEKQR